MMSQSEVEEKFAHLKKEDFPDHIAIIPNGHRTWARKVGKTPTEAHRVGMEILIDLSRFMRELGVHTVTVWAMSTENFKRRSQEEIKGLMGLLKLALNKWAQEFYEEGARIVHLGRKDHLPEDLRQLLSSWEEKSRQNTKHCANISFDYGGHDELLRAMEKAFQDIMAGTIKLADLWQEVGSYHGKYPYLKFKDYLDTGDQPHPYPDLIIRTSGECRLSGFMPWQSVYSEICSVPELMPEFTRATLKRALVDYASRKRTFGGNSNGNSAVSG